MSRKEREESKVFDRLSKGEISQKEAAARLGVTPRWVRKKLKRYQAEGDEGLLHRGRGRLSSRGWNQEEKALMIELLQSEWEGFGPTFTAEKLAELKGIKVSKETVRKAMIAAGIFRSNTRKLKHRKWRKRYPMFGQFVQLDGSPHAWFEDRAPECTLLAFIDDATGRVLWLEFMESEAMMSIMGATKSYFEKHGIPSKFYVDRGRCFKVNLNNEENERLTQWQRVMNDFRVEVIHAGSPQAKGRVERLNGILQDRLIKGMRLHNISSIEEGNRYLRESNFIEDHNKRFAVAPATKGDAHRSTELYDLNEMFYIKEERTLMNDFTIRYNKALYQLERNQKTIIRPKDKITIRTYLNGSIALSIRKTKLEFTKIDQRPKKPFTQEKTVKHIPNKPSLNSRRWVSGKAPIYRRPPERRVG